MKPANRDSISIAPPSRRIPLNQNSRVRSGRGENHAQRIHPKCIRQPGDGIFDSGLAAHEHSALGLAIVNDYVLIRLTRIGDVNLDGIVTIADFIDLSANFNHTGVTWQEGDMNGDGSVTIADFIDLSANFNGIYSGKCFPSQQQIAKLYTFRRRACRPSRSNQYCHGFLAALATVRHRRVQLAK